MEVHYDFLTLNESCMIGLPGYHGWNDIYDEFNNLETTLKSIRETIEYQHADKLKDKSFLFCEPLSMKPLDRLDEDLISLGQAYKMAPNRVRQLYIVFTPTFYGVRVKNLL